jgi:hypothetical protein
VPLTSAGVARTPTPVLFQWRRHVVGQGGLGQTAFP